MAESFPELMKDINCNFKRPSKFQSKTKNKQTKKNLTQHNTDHCEN